MRTRHLRRRETGNLALIALIIALLITITVFGLMSLAAPNTGAALGFGFIASIATVAAIMVFVEELSS